MLFSLLINTGCAQTSMNSENKISMTNNIKVEIWSDFMCPFCYLGKRNFEQALSKCSSKDSVTIVWKSFQLMPELKTDTTVNIHRFLAKAKGWSLETATQMNDRVGAAAKVAGLTYNYDVMKVANTFLAHCYSHYALQKGKQSEVEEQLFRAYFTEGKNLDDITTLTSLGGELGFDKVELEKALRIGQFISAVQYDIQQAEQMGINGVPFFLINGKYTVSGAQPSEVFLETLERAAKE
jgi:predicted DsbA family dithiol-disulfide isomerase